jgi:hypothetical protein
MRYLLTDRHQRCFGALQDLCRHESVDHIPKFEFGGALSEAFAGPATSSRLITTQMARREGTTNASGSLQIAPLLDKTETMRS